MKHRSGWHREGTVGLHHQRTFGLHPHRTTGSLVHRPTALNEASTNTQQPSTFDRELLRRHARWIRDELDAQVARDGPDVLHSDEMLELDEFLRNLLTSHSSLEDIRYSRIHLAVMSIAGSASRWPARLVDRCDALKEAWETEYGPLKQIGILLYEPGGRLHGICKADDLSKEKLLVKWLKMPDVKVSPLVARRFGDLGFKAGELVVNADLGAAPRADRHRQLVDQHAARVPRRHHRQRRAQVRHHRRHGRRICNPDDRPGRRSIANPGRLYISCEERRQRSISPDERHVGVARPGAHLEESYAAKFLVAQGRGKI